MDIFLYSTLFVFGKFIIYSVIGWILETFSGYLLKNVLINRGFLIGPYTPIYGVCGILLSWLLHNESNPIYVFVFSFLIASILEYLTSVIMEKMFKARWWDYSNRPFNINGRVYLGNSLIFGCLGCLLIEVIDPKLTFFLSGFDAFWFSVIMALILFVFLFDLMISFNIMKKIKLTAECIKKDYTEEITKKVKKILYDKSKPFRRIFEAFPNVSIFNKNFKSKNKK